MKLTSQIRKYELYNNLSICFPKLLVPWGSKAYEKSSCSLSVLVSEIMFNHTNGYVIVCHFVFNLQFHGD